MTEDGLKEMKETPEKEGKDVLASEIKKKGRMKYQKDSRKTKGVSVEENEMMKLHKW